MAYIDSDTRIIDLTVGDLMGILDKQPTITSDTTNKGKRFVYGMAGIAQLFNCSIATANRIKQSGRISRAVSQVGNKIVVDADLALELNKK